MNEGGAAAQGGFSYQNRLAAWAAVHILAEAAGPRLWGAHGLPVRLSCETDNPVDDLEVTLESSGRLLVQAKRKLSLSSAPGSPLAKAVDQFVRQYLVTRRHPPVAQPEGATAPELRFVCATLPQSAKTVTTALPAALDRLRSAALDADRSAAARSNPERDALRTLLRLSTEAWGRHAGAAPTDVELDDFLKLVHFKVVDVEPGGTDESLAINLLKQSVLRDPAQAESCWSLIIEMCAGFAKEHSGADRAGLASRLRVGGFALKTARSYEGDIQRAREKSRALTASLADLTRIRVGDADVRIERAVASALHRAAAERSVLVVGEPGAGKSAALLDLASRLERQQRDYVFLAADRVGGPILAELGLTRDLPALLAAWEGDGSAYLIIDGLDAARAEAPAAALMVLIADTLALAPRWRVVASMRKFDLRYNQELRRLFAAPGRPATPSAFQDGEFFDSSHVNVPLLDDSELDQACAQSQQVASTLDEAAPDTRELLRVPFNLRLLGDLIGAGAPPNELQPLRTQIQLLEKYWAWWVRTRGARGMENEAALRTVCTEMVRARSLRAPRQAIPTVELEALARLLSNNVLSEEPGRQRLEFSHHVLFDYATSKVFLPSDGDGLVTGLRNDPELAIAIRPSYVFLFRRAWDGDASRHAFWSLALQVASSDGIPEIAKVVAPAVAAEMARSETDLGPLLSALLPAAANAEAAEKLADHVIGALIAGTQVVDWTVWCQFAARLSALASPRTSYSVSHLLSLLLDGQWGLSRAQIGWLGEASRQLLTFAWTKSPRDGWLVVQALRHVCTTFGTDPSASGALLRPALERAHVREFGFEELPWIARGLHQIARSDPDLAVALFHAAFSNEEPSQDKTAIFPSRIQGFSSNRKQDFEMARYTLSQAFRKFLEAHPDAGTSAMIAALDGYVATEGHYADSPPEENFAFDGTTARIRSDGSAAWDGHQFTNREPAIEIASSFSRWLERQAAENLPALDEAIAKLKEENRAAVVWRRLLKLGAQNPLTVGPRIAALAAAPPVLLCPDTSTEAGQYIRAVFQNLATGTRQAIIDAILALPATAGDARVSGELARDRLLGCLNAELIADDRARSILEELRAGGGPPANEPAVQLFGPFSRSFTETDYLREQGVPTGDAPDARLIELWQPVRDFAAAHLNTSPEPAKIAAILPHLKSLRAALSPGVAAAAHSSTVDMAWGYLAEGCERISKAKGQNCESQAGDFARKVLLEASLQPAPEPHDGWDEAFDENPAWGGPWARLLAAEGLTTLCAAPGCARPDLLAAVEHLAEDAVPPVRFQVVTRLGTLYEPNRELMWRLLEGRCRQDASRGVLSAAVGLLWRLSGPEPGRAAALIAAILERSAGQADARLRASCANALASIYAWKGEPAAGSVTAVLIRAGDPQLLAAIIAPLRRAFTDGPAGQPGPNSDAVRLRAFDLLERAAGAIANSLRAIQAEQRESASEELPEVTREMIKGLLGAAENAAKELYFASGAFRRGPGAEAAGGGGELGVEERRRFYREARPAMQQLAVIGTPAVAHSLLETLESLIEFDPPSVFLDLCAAVQSSVEGGYQYEALAADLVVRVVDRYLAQFRQVFRESKDCRDALIRLLDTFVKVGWPAARQLTYHLEEIFR